MTHSLFPEAALVPAIARQRIGLGLACAILLSSLPARADYVAPASGQDGFYSDAAGNPTYEKTKDGKWDWRTYSGYLRYNSNCIVCHGPDGAGSTYAPALTDSLKHLDYQQFTATVVQGKQDVNAASNLVMPSFGVNKNVMCYLDDIYVYLKARSDNALGRVRPDNHDPKPEEWKKAEASCMGPE